MARDSDPLCQEDSVILGRLPTPGSDDLEQTLLTTPRREGILGREGRSTNGKSNACRWSRATPTVCLGVHKVSRLSSEEFPGDRNPLLNQTNSIPSLIDTKTVAVAISPTSGSTLFRIALYATII